MVNNAAHRGRSSGRTLIFPVGGNRPLWCEDPARSSASPIRHDPQRFLETTAVTINRIENGQRFCNVLTYNGVAYLAGMTADNTSGDTVAQTEAVLAKIDRALKLAGTDKTKLLTATIWLRDIADFDKMNTVWDKWIDRSALPVRATVEARLAGPHYRVEIQVTAAA